MAREACKDEVLFCADHLDHRPHVIRVQAAIAGHKALLTEIQRTGRVELDSPIVRDVVVGLAREGRVVVSRLAKALGFPDVVVDVVGKALADAGLAERTDGGHGPGTVALRLLGPGRSTTTETPV